MTTIEPGRLTLDLSTLGTRIATEHDATEQVAGRGPTAVLHDQRITLLETRLTGEIGVAHDLAAGAMLPFRIDVGRIRYLEPPARNEVALEMPNIHHRNETLSGLGDPWLWLRYGRGLRGWVLGARAGVTLPFGRTEPDPFALGAQGLPHQHVQHGTGAVAPLAGVEVMRRWPSWSLLAWLVTVQNVARNRHGYLPGDRYAAALTAIAPLGTERFEVQAGLELQAETAERWQGLVPTDDGNRGRVDLLGSVAGSVRIGERFNVALSVKVPAYVHVESAQLSYPLIAMLSLGAAIDVWATPHVHEDEDEDEDEDGHGHGGGHGGGRADIADAGPAGAAVELVPVAGKVTVYDFWAAWCVPCRELDRRLGTLARKHPDRLAVRRLDVIDDASPAWKRHLALGDFALPHVKVLGRDGKLAFQRTGGPREIVEAIEGLVGVP